MTVPALFSCLLFLERVEKRSGAGLGSRSVPPRLRRCSCGRGHFCSGPRAHSRAAAGRTGAVTREPTGPGPGHRTRSFAAAFAGVRTLCVVFIQTQIRLNYGRELDARASEGSVGKCLRERSDHDHWISPRNGEQNWHTVRSGCCNARRGIASRIHENSPIPSSVPDAAQLLARPCRVGTDPFNLLKSCVNFPFSYTPCCGLEWHLPFEG